VEVISYQGGRVTGDFRIVYDFLEFGEETESSGSMTSSVGLRGRGLEPFDSQLAPLFKEKNKYLPSASPLSFYCNFAIFS
jgi:hypothetical protein